MSREPTPVFLTGIEGFVGSRLARHLHDRGHRISGSYWLDPKADLGFAATRRCDLRDAGQIRSQLAEANPGYIVHLAGISSVTVAERDPQTAFQANVVGAVNLLEAARALGSNPRILLISSSEVYDLKAANGAQLTEESPVRPMSFYAVTKLCAENAGRYLADRYELDIVILRPFSHTGPGQALDFVFPSVARQIAELEQRVNTDRHGANPRSSVVSKGFIEIGNSAVARDYVDIRDACRAYELALSGTSRGETYNVTSERPLRIGDGINYLLSLSKVPITVKVAPARVRSESSMLTGSGAKFRVATGWQAEIDIHQTLKDLLDYERNQVISNIK